MFQDSQHAPLTFDDKLGALYHEESELSRDVDNPSSLDIPLLASGTYTIPVSPPNKLPTQEPRHRSDASGLELPWCIGANHNNKELSSDGTSPVLSVLPASGETAGLYTLPHLVFRDPHLPWARNPCTTTADENETNTIPWLALVAFTADELALNDEERKSFFSLSSTEPNAKLNSNMGWDLEAGAAGKIHDSIPSSSGIDRLTNLVLKAQDETSTVKTSAIAIRRALFTALFTQDGPNETACSIYKYRFLAHVNEIESIDGDKENPSTTSVVISHRTGPLDITSPTPVYVHLVSLEGVDGIQTTGIRELVLLTSLYSWSYTAVPGSPDTRTAAFQQLGKFSTDPTKSMNGLPMLRVNYQNELIDKEEFPTPAKQQVMRILDQGYSMARYRTQTGELTAALMRGALAPVQVPHPLGEGFPPQSGSGIKLQLLNPELGMMDISYDAAWNLGKTMALADQAFTTAVTRLRHVIRTSASTSGGNYTVPDNSDYAIIQEWVLDKTHLAGIPSQYLISDASAVPKESIRFFYIDQNWIDSLVDGALSLSNYQVLDPSMDQCRNALKVKLNEDLSRPIENLKYLQKPPMYGFILRSETFGGFPGLDVRAEFEKEFYSRNEFHAKRTAPALQRRLSSDTLLVLFPCEPPTLQRIQLALPAHQSPFVVAAMLDRKHDIIEVEFAGTETSKDFQLSALFDWDTRAIKIPEYAEMFEGFLEETRGTFMPITPAGFASMLRGRSHALDIHLAASETGKQKDQSWGHGHISPDSNSATKFYFINPEASRLIPVNIQSQQNQDELAQKPPTPLHQGNTALNVDGSSLFALDVTALDSRYVPTNRPKPVDLIFNIRVLGKPLVPSSKLERIQIRVSIGDVVDEFASPFNPENESERRPLIQRDTVDKSPGPAMISNLRLRVLRQRTDDELILELIPRSKEGVYMSTLEDTTFLLPMVNIIPWRILPDMWYRSWVSMKWVYQVSNGEEVKTEQGEREFVVYMGWDPHVQ